MAKMQGTEDEGAGSVLKYMTKPESDSNEADWLLGCSINYGIRNVQKKVLTFWLLLFTKREIIGEKYLFSAIFFCCCPVNTLKAVCHILAILTHLRGCIQNVF